MGFNAISVTLATAGTPQRLTATTSPALPTITSNGQTQTVPTSAFQITIQSLDTNTGKAYIGGPALNVGTKAACGAVLAPGASITLGQYGAQLLLDDIWADCSVSGTILLISLVG
jgi:hypothetical protein